MANIASDNQGRTPIHFALDEAHAGLVELLLGKANILVMISIVWAVISIPPHLSVI